MPSAIDSSRAGRSRRPRRRRPRGARRRSRRRPGSRRPSPRRRGSRSPRTGSGRRARRRCGRGRRARRARRGRATRRRRGGRRPSCPAPVSTSRSSGRSRRTSRERLEQPRVVLVRPGVRGVEQESARGGGRRAGSARGRRARWIARTRAGSRLEPLDQRLPGVLGDRDHDPALPDRPAVDAAPVGELGAREELREDLVLHVEHGRRGGRCVHRRQHHAEREVDRVQLAGGARGAAGPGRAPASAIAAMRPASTARRGTRGRRWSGSAAARVRRDRRHERVVLELARPGASALQSSRAYVSEPPTTPGTSVSIEIPTTRRSHSCLAPKVPGTGFRLTEP